MTIATAAGASASTPVRPASPATPRRARRRRGGRRRQSARQRAGHRSKSTAANRTIANQANSSRCRPLNQALNGEPVRISPGVTVVTRMPVVGELGPEARSRARSARTCSRSTGARCGTPILPPIDEMLTMRPPPARALPAPPHASRGAGPRNAWPSPLRSRATCHVLERPDLDHAGVVDEHIETAVAIDGFADDAGGLGLARDVGDDRRRIDAARRQIVLS